MGNLVSKIRFQEQESCTKWLNLGLQRKECENQTNCPAVGSNLLIVETIVEFLPFSYIPKLRLVNRTWRDACQKRFASEANLKLKAGNTFWKISKIYNFSKDISFRKFTIWHKPKSHSDPKFWSDGTRLLQFLRNIGPKIEFLDCRLHIFDISRILEIIHKELKNLTHLTLNIDLPKRSDFESERPILTSILRFCEMDLQKIPQLKNIKKLQIELFWDRETNRNMLLERTFCKTAEILLKSCTTLKVLITRDREFLEAVYQILLPIEPARSGLSSQILIDFPQQGPNHLNISAFIRFSQLRFRRVSVKILDKDATLPEVDLAKQEVNWVPPVGRYSNSGCVRGYSLLWVPDKPHIALQLELNALTEALEKQKLNLVHLHIYIGNQGYQEKPMEFFTTLSNLELPELRILRLSFCLEKLHDPRFYNPRSSAENIRHVTENLRLNWEERFPKLFALFLDCLELNDLQELFSNLCSKDEEFLKPLKSVKVLGCPVCKYYFTNLIPRVDVLFPNLIWFVNIEYHSLRRGQVVDSAKVHYWSVIRDNAKLEDSVRLRYKYPLVEDSRFISQLTDCIRFEYLSNG